MIVRLCLATSSVGDLTHLSLRRCLRVETAGKKTISSFGEFS